jgi:hypothetical protein
MSIGTLGVLADREMLVLAAFCTGIKRGINEICNSVEAPLTTAKLSLENTIDLIAFGLGGHLDTNLLSNFVKPHG